MVKIFKKTTVSKTKANDYQIVAKNFFDGAKVASEFEYWNAAGVLIVHSAIAYGDAVTIKFGSVKSKGENHQDLVNLIDSLVAQSEEKKKALMQLSKILDHKNLVSYSGDIYERKDIDKLWKFLERFILWAENMLNN
ncbi:MAG TPA: hypothetical protein VIL99_05920 [Ignavibacteria bacterium]|jgi:hypothetical protein